MSMLARVMGRDKRVLTPWGKVSASRAGTVLGIVCFYAQTVSLGRDVTGA